MRVCAALLVGGFTLALAAAGCDANPGADRGSAQPAVPGGLAAARPDAPKPSSPFSKALTRYGLELYAASRAQPGGAALEARARAEGWKPAPPELRPLHRVPTAWLAPFEGQQVIVGQDAARGMVVVAAMHGFDAAAAKRELESRYTLETLNRLNSPESMLSQYFLKDAGQDHALAAIMLATGGDLRGAGVVGFLPPEVARRELDAAPAAPPSPATS